MAHKRPRGRAASWAAASPPSPAMRRSEATAQPKPTYLLQKEEREKLLEEAAFLEEQLEALRMQAGLPSREDRVAISKTEAQSVDLDERIVANTLEIGRVHSLVTQKLLSSPLPPVSTYIHLPRDMDERCEILRSLKHMKLQRAERFIRERFYYIDPTKEYLKEERYTGADGLFHCDRYEIHQFPNFHSVQQLYDALLYFLSTMEITVTDMIGQLTLREDCDDIEPTIWNHRIVTTTEDVGCIEELNLAGFAHFYGSHGVITYETIDGDDLYPYRPHERTRKDCQVMNVVSEAIDPETNQNVVLWKSCTLTKELEVGFQLPPSVEKKLQEHASRWSTLIVQYLREYKVSSMPNNPVAVEEF